MNKFKVKLLSVLFVIGCGQLALASEPYGKCWKCHQLDGRSFVDEVITISGQNKNYLINQLYRFKSGERQERLLHLMNGIAASLTDEEIENVAAYYSRQDPRKTFPKLEKMNMEELRLYKIGQSHAHVCLSCHADAETRPAIRNDWPYISGQNRPALVIQLEAFSDGDRENPMMNFIKSPPFNDPDVIEGLALYFSRQQPPAPAK